MYFFKNKLINKVIDESLKSWAHTLNASEFVQPKYLKTIDNKIFDNMKQQFKDLEIYYLLWLQEKGYGVGIFAKLRIWFSGLKPLWLSYKNEIVATFDKAEAELQKEKTPPELPVNEQTETAEPPAENDTGTAEPLVSDPHDWDVDAEIAKEKEFRQGKAK